MVVADYLLPCRLSFSKARFVLLVLFTGFIGYAQEEMPLKKSSKVSPFFGYFVADNVEGMALTLKYEYLKGLGESLRAKQGFEASLGYCANGFIQYDEFGPGQSRPKSGVLVGMHSNWYYDLAPSYWMSPVGQAGAGLLMVKRVPASAIYDFYLSSNVGAGLRFGRPQKPFNLTMLLATQFGYKPANWFYAFGYQLGFEWEL